MDEVAIQEREEKQLESPQANKVDKEVKMQRGWSLLTILHILSHLRYFKVTENEGNYICRLTIPGTYGQMYKVHMLTVHQQRTTYEIFQATGHNS